MIRTTLYAILLAFIITLVTLFCGFLLVKMMVAMLDYFDEEEEETETYEESSTTTPPTSTTEPTLPPLSEITLQELDARMRYLESEINRLWHTILRAR